MSDYSAEIAPTGQAPSHAPQSVHVAASTTYGVPSAIASTGQVDAQAPQEIQSLEILCAIIFTSNKLSLYNITLFHEKKKVIFH